MELFDYSELIRVIDNVEIREEKEKAMALIELKEKYRELERTIVESGILDDWNRLKQLCLKANIRLCVSHLGSDSMGRIIGHKEDFEYCQEYKNNGLFCKCMSSGSSWADYYGFRYDEQKGVIWKITHNTDYYSFQWFKTEEDKYNTKINLLEKFRDVYEDYRCFQLKQIEKKFKTRVKSEDIIKKVEI